MECLTCRYDLSGVPAGPCPECGQKFDPRDRATYGPILSRRLPRRWLFWVCPIAAAAPLWVHAWLHLMLIVARLELGRWPHRGGADDPSCIPWVNAMHALGWLGILASPVLIPLGVAGLAFLFVYEPVRALVLAGIVGLCWAATFLLGDPAQVWVWFMD
jgi:hypothetical protein